MTEGYAKTTSGDRRGKARGRLALLKAALNNLRHHAAGRCNICGKITVFVCADVVTSRNNMYCLFCRSLSRSRHVAKVILQEVAKSVSAMCEIPEAKKFAIYNTDTLDAFSKVLGKSRSYYSSGFFPGMKPETQMRERVSCQDVEELTFEDGMFDLVITEDVLEHVRHHERAFQEILRVLKVGGHHVFTVPCFFDRPTVVRVDTSGEEDIHLLPPEYHGDSIRGKILAYRTFGIDVFDLLGHIGFETAVDFSRYLDQRWGIFDSYVFISKKVACR